MVPMWLAKAALPLCSIYYKIKKRLPMFYSYSLYTLNTNSIFSPDKARLKPGYVTRPFPETLVDTIEWLKKEKSIL